MKKIFSLVFMLCAFSFVSCSSDDATTDQPIVNPDPIDTTLYLKFSANGQAYSFEPETIGSLRKLIMGGIMENDSYTRLSLWMPVNPTIGTHQLVDATVTDANINTLYTADFWIGDDVFDATSGTVTITEIDSEYIKGTFSFTGTKDGGATTTISNGSFRAYK